MHMRNSWLLVNSYIYKLLGMISVELTLSILGSIDDVKDVVTWIFLEVRSDVQLFSWTSAKAIKLKLDVINSVKEDCAINRPEYIFRKSHVTKLMNS